MLEETQMFPASLNGVMNRAKLAGFRIGKTSPALEIDDEIQRFERGPEIRARG